MTLLLVPVVSIIDAIYYRLSFCKFNQCLVVRFKQRSTDMGKCCFLSQFPVTILHVIMQCKQLFLFFFTLRGICLCLYFIINPDRLLKQYYCPCQFMPNKFGDRTMNEMSTHCVSFCVHLFSPTNAHLNWVHVYVMKKETQQTVDIHS